MAYLNASYAVSEQFYGFEVPATLDMPDVSRTFALTEGDREHILDFLARRPVHTAKMAALIHDNGVVSQDNSSTFYAYHDRFGELEGVALIGEDTYFESRSDEAFAALAVTAGKFEGTVKRIHSTDDLAIDFWVKAFGGTSSAGAVAHEDVFELTFPAPVVKCKYTVRPATKDDLEETAAIQARMAIAANGVDPLTVDGAGFLTKLEKLIERDRILIATDGGRIVFIAELSSLSEDAAVLENIFISEEILLERDAAVILTRTGIELAGVVKHVCIKDVVNDAGVFARAGYRFTGRSTTVTV